MKIWGLNLTAIALLLLSTLSFANPKWNDWVEGVKQQALAEGISATLFDKVFADINEPSRTVKGLARSSRSID